jgi:mono/diheme cytochrome c family protein
MRNEKWKMENVRGPDLTSRVPSDGDILPKLFKIQHKLIRDGDPGMNSAKFAAIILVIGCFATACNSSGTLTTDQTQPSAAPATAAATTTPDPFAKAYLNFQKNCQECHGEKGQGGTVEIKDRKLKVPSLRDGHALKHTDEKFVKQISEGDDEMPAFKDKLSAEEINELVRFIRKELQGK